MKKTIAVMAVLVAALALSWVLAGCALTGKLAAEQAGMPKEKVDAHGLFIESCATCHGEDGKAKTMHGRMVGAQDLTDAQWQATTTDAEIVNAIKTGPKAMPAFEGKLSNTEIEALAAYVRTFKAAS